MPIKRSSRKPDAAAHSKAAAETDTLPALAASLPQPGGLATLVAVAGVSPAIVTETVWAWPTRKTSVHR
jgi:hypothetical protein